MLRISASTLRWLYQFLFGTFSCIKAIGLFKLFHIEWGEAVCIFQETGLLYQSCQIYVCRVVLSLPFIIFFKGLWWYLLFHSRSWWSISFLFYFSVLVEVCQFIDLFEEPFLHCFSVLISLISAFIYFLPLSRFFFPCLFFWGSGWNLRRLKGTNDQTGERINQYSNLTQVSKTISGISHLAQWIKDPAELQAVCGTGRVTTSVRVQSLAWELYMVHMWPKK